VIARPQLSRNVLRYTSSEGLTKRLLNTNRVRRAPQKSTGSGEVRSTSVDNFSWRKHRAQKFLRESSIMPKGKSRASANSSRDAGYPKKKAKKIKKKSSQKKTSSSRRKTKMATQTGVSRRRALSNAYC